MLNFPNTRILDQHRKLISVIDALYESCPDIIPISQLLRDLESIRVAENEDLGAGNKDPYTLHDCSQDELLSHCNELRLRMIASALSVAPQSVALATEKALSTSHVFDKQSEEIVGEIVWGQGELLHGAVGKARVMILPRITSDSQCHLIYQEFSELFVHTPSVKDWVLDFSQLKEAPILLIANVVAYAQELRRSGSDLHLCWVRPELFCESQQKRLLQYFKLKKIGGFYFSRYSVTSPLVE